MTNRLEQLVRNRRVRALRRRVRRGRYQVPALSVADAMLERLEAHRKAGDA